jgi:hypothetical protein
MTAGTSGSKPDSLINKLTMQACIIHLRYIIMTEAAVDSFQLFLVGKFSIKEVLMAVHTL